jgi:Holliday junction resolvase RusA-like endonuclease
MKKRKDKQKKYDKLFNNIPRDYNERLEWLSNNLHLNSMKMDTIVGKYNTMKERLYFKRFFIVLYEIPEGSPRPRFRLVNRKNLRNMAIANPNFIHVYSPVGAEDNKYMKRLLTKDEFKEFSNLIYTPCIVDYKAFFKTPSSFNSVEKYLAELGVYTPISKPDWDNIGKKYCDMTNENLWVDDRLVIQGTVEKLYSVLPRVEITIDFLNMLQNRHQAESIRKIYKDDIRYFDDGRDE